ncbi:hypothetical protein [Lysobacter sp. HA18]
MRKSRHDRRGTWPDAPAIGRNETYLAEFLAKPGIREPFDLVKRFEIVRRCDVVKHADW